MPAFLEPKKILWAVDAYQERSAAFRDVTAAMARFARLFGARVEIVYAYRAPKLYMAPKAFAEFEKPYLDQARESLEAVAKGLKGVSCGVAVISGRDRGGKGSELKLLLDYARKKRFDAVAVATHGRNAVMKMFVGSFAEGLLAHSKLPLLAVSPHLKHVAAKPVKKVLFPTDFSARSKRLFEALLALAKKRDFEVRLVHGLVNVYLPMVLSDAPLMGVAVSMQSGVFQESLARQKKFLHAWVGEGKRKGVKVSGEIYSSGTLVSDVIFESAEKNRADLIVMATWSGKPSNEGMGSVTKKVIRKSRVPVLVLKY